MKTYMNHIRFNTVQIFNYFYHKQIALFIKFKACLGNNNAIILEILNQNMMVLFLSSDVHGLSAKQSR